MTLSLGTPAAQAEDLLSIKENDHSCHADNGGLASRPHVRPGRKIGNLEAAFGRASSGAEIVVRESLNPGWLV